MKKQKQELENFYKGILEKTSELWETMALLDQLQDINGRSFFCAGCGGVFPISKLKQYEYYGDKGLSHCCRNLSSSQGPPAYVRTSWDTLERAKEMVNAWAKAAL